MVSSFRNAAVLSLFFGSGATALIYEVVWSKYLSQMFGSTIQAQTVVLAVFMGGLALGNRVFGSKADHLLQPLRSYGYVEIAIGLYAFCFPFSYRLADGLFVSVGSHLWPQRELLLAFKGLLSVTLLIVPTILMGGTLPLLAAWLQKNSVEAGRRSARFYSVNSLGAVAGAALAGFYLVQTAGMVAALQITALVNVIIGSTAILLGSEKTGNGVRTLPSEEKIDDPIRSWRWAGALVALTGGVSMGLELLASRSISLLLGSSLQSFAVVLIAFILGIGAGSAVIASAKLRQQKHGQKIALLLLAAATWVGLLVMKLEWWVEFYRIAKSGLARSTVGYIYYQFFAAFVSILMLGLPAALIGAVLPLLIRSLARPDETLGNQIGRLLTWNTLGAVAGVLLTGFALMPRLGLRNAFGVLALCLAGIAIGTAWRHRMPRFAVASAALIALLAALFESGGEGWRHAISSGAFRSRETEVIPGMLAKRKQFIKILFYEDAPDATVSVEKGPSRSGNYEEVGLRINGKTDASSHGDLSTQMLLGHLPLLARPESKDVFVLGLGGGITGGAVLKHPVEHLTIAENCEPVVRAARFFEPWNGGVLNDKRTELRIEDARTVLKLNPARYDVIITQPSNPWMAGVGSVFSREYYELAASRLKEGGMVAQWFHLYDMHDGIVAMVLRTFGTVFPYVEVWDAGAGDLVLLGSKRPWTSSAEHYQKAFDRERVRQDLTRIGLRSADALLARQLASQRTGFAIPGAGPIQSDLFPMLEYEAPKAFYLGISSGMLGQFDERTWQMELAAPPKRAALGTLDAQQIKEVFTDFWTVNSNLVNYVVWRIGNDSGDERFSEPPDVRRVPCVFRPAQAVPVSSGSTASNPEIQRLLAAVELFGSDPPHQREGVLLFESLLRERKPQSDWSVPHYTALAVKAALQARDTDRAAALLQLGFRSAPDDAQLHYLTRILEREQRESPQFSSTQ
jgi:spermidine synthase